MGQGSFIHVLNKPFGGFTVKTWWTNMSWGLVLEVTTLCFLCFVKSSTGVMTACKVPICYVNAREYCIVYWCNCVCPRYPCTSARASAATQVAEAGFEVNTGTTVMSYIRSERPLQRVQLALGNGLNGRSSGAVNVSDTQWLDTGSSSVLSTVRFCSAGSSSFSPAVRWENSSSSCSCCCCVIFFRAGKKWFFILNTLSTTSKHYVVGGVPSFLWVHPPWANFFKVSQL